MVFHVPGEIAECSAEKICDHLPRELDHLVSIVVFVVGTEFSNSQFSQFTNGFSEENCLVVPVVASLSEVRQQSPVENGLCTPHPELVEHSVRDPVTDVHQSVFGGLCFGCLFERDVQSVLDFWFERNSIRNFLVSLQTQGAHNNDQWQVHWRTGQLYADRFILLQSKLEFGAVTHDRRVYLCLVISNSADFFDVD